ncbi:MAG: hypothetical protein IPM46_06090 [Flavobacteriales bacterium]|nr:hypothetical protein [Flavobacteriales bacterium]
MRIILLLLGLLTIHRALAQGCSDAGVCTAGPMGQIAMGTDSADAKEPRHFARLMFSYAVGEQDVVIVQVQPEISLGITNRLSLQLKVPYISASGNLGDNSGMGDMVTTLSYAFIKQSDRNLTAITGVRLPTGRFSPANFNQATYGPTSHPLPMPYQVGLGTTDLLLGAQYRHKRWTGTIAYQHVLKQDNQSTFLHRYWQDVPEAQGYFESFALERANDAVARVQYAIPIKRLTLQPGLLGIYHLGLDSRLEIDSPPNFFESSPPVRRDVEGSDGLTLNITADARYALSDAWALEASFGSPVIVREARPDGLTRHFVISAGLRFAF